MFLCSRIYHNSSLKVNGYMFPCSLRPLGGPQYSLKTRFENAREKIISCQSTCWRMRDSASDACYHNFSAVMLFCCITRYWLVYSCGKIKRYNACETSPLSWVAKISDTCEWQRLVCNHWLGERLLKSWRECRRQFYRWRWTLKELSK